MDELVRTAEIYYNCSTYDVKSKAYEFFRQLDYNSDRKVSLHEFLEFMREEGHQQMNNLPFFQALDRDNSGTLEFMEVMALYYVIKSGRPFCSGCSAFIPGMYFTCLNCFGYRNPSYCVCPRCFNNGTFIHDRTHQFLDNYALLEGKRKEALSKRNEARPNQHQPSSSATYASTMNAIVPYNEPKPKPWKYAYRIFEAAVSGAVGGAVGNSCNIL